MSRNTRGLLLVGFCLIIPAAFGWYVFQSISSKVSSGEETSGITLRTAKKPELTTTTILSGLSNSWDVGFLTDGTILFTERAGQISTVKNGAKVALLIPKGLYNKGEAGMMGLTVDPEFNKNRFVYACYATTKDIRVSRWKVNDTVTTLTDQKDILTGMPF